MKAFFTYLYCMLTSRNIAFLYEMDLKDSWKFFSQRVKNYRARNDEEEVYLSINENTIAICEYYESDMQHKGSPRVIKNQTFTTITNNQSKIQIKIEIQKPFESRIFTNLISFLNLLFLVSSITVTVHFFRHGPNSNFKLILIYLFQFILFCSLILNWLLTRQRHLQIIKDIEKIINDI